MSNILIVNISGIIGTILATVSFMPQVYKTYQTENVEGLSPLFILLTIIGSVIWMFYAYCLKSWHQFTANCIVGILAIILMILYFYYQNKEQYKNENNEVKKD